MLAERFGCHRNTIKELLKQHPALHLRRLRGTHE
jgi:hypothetical protein